MRRSGSSVPVKVLVGVAAACLLLPALVAGAEGVAAGAAPAAGATAPVVPVAAAAPGLAVVPAVHAVVVTWRTPGRVVATRLVLSRWSAHHWSTVARVVTGPRARARTFARLVDGVTYGVRAQVLVGRTWGPWSPRRTAVSGSPGPVGGMSVVGGDGSLVVRWVGPPAAHGSSVTSYRIGVRRLLSAASATSWLTVPAREVAVLGRVITASGLRNGTKYALVLQAVNARGRGGLASATAVPHRLGVPGALALLPGAAGQPPLDSKDDYFFLSLSPDHRRLAYTLMSTSLAPQDTNDTCDVYVTDLVTGESALVSAAADGTVGAGCSERPVWSPDSRRIAFVSEARNLTADITPVIVGVFVKDLVTGEVVRMTGADGDGSGDQSSIERWSGDGRLLLISRCRCGGITHTYEDLAVDVVTQAAHRLPDSASGGEFSPDGSQLAYVTQASSRSLVVLDTGTWVRVRSLDDPAGGFAVAWSPDGRWLAHTGYDGAGVLEVGTGNDRIVSGEYASEPTFSPDSRTLTVEEFEMEGESTRIVDLGTGSTSPACPTRTLPSGGSCRDAVWSPSGTRLLLDVGGWEEGFVPGEPGFSGPALRTMGTTTYALPFSTAEGHAFGTGAEKDIPQWDFVAWLDETHLVFTTRDPLVPGDTDESLDVYIKALG